MDEVILGIHHNYPDFAEFCRDADVSMAVKDVIWEGRLAGFVIRLDTSALMRTASLIS